MKLPITQAGWLLGAGLLACAGVAGAQTLNLYSARHYDADEQLYAAFTEATGIEVNLLEGNADQLIERIRREGAASPADVFMTVDAARLYRAETAGILAPVESEVLEQRLASELRHPDNLWFGFSSRARLIFFDPDVYAEAPVQTYEELADPRFQDEICIRSSSNDYNQSLVASLIAAHGVEATEEWAEGLVSNLARQPQGGDTDQIRGVAAGECSIAVANHYYWVRLQLSDNAADQAVAEGTVPFFPNQAGRGTHRNIGGAAMVDGSRNPDAARAFLEFLTTDEAQRFFALGNHEFPVVEGVQPPEVVQAFTEYSVDPLDISVLGDNNAEAVRLMDRVGWR